MVMTAIPGTPRRITKRLPVRVRLQLELRRTAAPVAMRQRVVKAATVVQGSAAEAAARAALAAMKKVSRASLAGIRAAAVEMVAPALQIRVQAKVRPVASAAVAAKVPFGEAKAAAAAGADKGPVRKAPVREEPAARAATPLFLRAAAEEVGLAEPPKVAMRETAVAAELVARAESAAASAAEAETAAAPPMTATAAMPETVAKAATENSPAMEAAVASAAIPAGTAGMEASRARAA